MSHTTGDRDRVIGELATRIAAIVKPHPVRVAIDGVDAAGKTTLADDLARVIEQRGRVVVRASVDGFHNPAAIRWRRGALSPEGYFQDSFNYDALVASLLDPLGPGGSRDIRRAVFDFRIDAPIDVPTEHVQDDAILIFDGVFLLRRELRGHFDFSIFVDADFAVTVARAETRDLALFGSVDDVRRRYAERYVPGQRLYLESADPKGRASMVIDNNDPARPVVRNGDDRDR